jgi:hypothetical protein
MTEPTAPLARRHLQLGLWALLVFLTLGGALEGLHGFKLAWLLDVGNEARRLTLRLAHAHGALLGMLHVLFGLLLASPLAPDRDSARRASACLSAALVLLPGGFLLGGLFARGGDPGPGVLLVPVGALLLVAAIALTLRGTRP